MRQAQTVFEIATPGRGLHAFTRDVAEWARAQGMESGLLTLFCRHTSASLLIQENADPDVLADLDAYFAAIAPEAPGKYLHSDEGPDDMPAHLRTALTQTSLSIPVMGGRLGLGRWQGIYLFEHRARPHRREVVGHLVGS